jgi:hypothetical protein
VAPFTGLFKLELGAPGHHLAAMPQEGFQHLFQIEQAWLTIEQGHHVHAEGVLHLGLFVEVVEHDLGHFAALQLDHHAHAGLVRLVANFGNALDGLLAHQFADLGAQVGLVHLVGQFIDDDGLTPVRPVDFLEVDLGTHHHATAPGAIPFAHAFDTIDDGGGRKIGGGNNVDQLVEGNFGPFQHGQAGVDHFVQVVRWNVGGHADRDAGRTVDQQIGNLGRQDQRLMFGTVVVGAEIDGFLVDVGKQFVGDLRHADFGVTHGRRVVAVDRTEVALTINQRVAQGEVLRHADDGVIHRRVAVRVVFTDHVTDDTGRLLVGLIPVVRQLVHGKQGTPVYRLETVPHIRQRTAHDHAHGVVEVGAAHLLFKADGKGLFGELFHGGVLCRYQAEKQPDSSTEAHPDRVQKALKHQ